MAWLSGWSYRKGLAIGSQTDLTDYQVRVLVGESPAVVGTNVNCEVCLPSFNDLRFTQSDGTTLLSYWIEEVSGVSPLQIAVVWVKVVSITANTPIFLYSGNASASAGSNGIDTFLFFDDASTNRSSEYTTQGVYDPAASGSLTWSGGSYSLRVNSFGHTSARINSLGNIKNIALHTELYRETNASNQQGGLVLCYTPSYSTTSVLVRYLTPSNLLQVGSYIGGGGSTNYALPQASWKKLMAALSDNSLVVTLKNLDNTVIFNSIGVPTTSVTPGFWGFFGAADVGAITRYRRTFVRKYTSPEPTVLYTFSLLAEYTAVPLSGYVPLPVQFQDLSTSSEIITGWNWDFGDGNTSVVQNPTHTYDAPGSYTVSLTASDGVDSATQTKSNYITVNATVADFTADSLTVPADSIVNFTDTSAGNITNWLWDFGGGVTSTDQNPSHVYTVADAYDVTLTVTDVVGTVTTITKTDYITCLLVPKFDVSATSGYSPLTVTFTESSLGSPSGWDWDFGDGKGHSTEANPTYTYVNLGTYTITLTITKDGVPPAILSKTVTVNTTAIIHQLTRDIDDSRINSDSCIIASPLGQLFVFYSKVWYTGKKSYSRITFTTGTFSVQVQAGNGILNGSTIDWVLTNLTASSEKYELVYVTPDGTVHIDSNITMTEMRTVLPLAYVKSGLYSIAQIEELEWTGRYIFIRKQVYTGSEWVWDDYEYRLNTGEQPKAFYDVASNRIYLSYKKDSISYSRMFIPTDETTWEYLPNVTIASNSITLNHDPQNSIVASISAGNKVYVNISSDEYPLNTTGFCFVGDKIYVYLPHIGGSFVGDAYGPLTYEFLTFVDGTYIVEASFTIPYMNYRLGVYEYRFKEWTGTVGTKYIRIRTFTHILIGEYVTPSDKYLPLELYDYPALVSPLQYYDVTNEIRNVDSRDKRAVSVISAGYKAVVQKTAEYWYTDLVSIKDDTSDPVFISAGYKAVVQKTAEYWYTDIIKDIDNVTDPLGVSTVSAISAGYKMVFTIVSYPIS